MDQEIGEEEDKAWWARCERMTLRLMELYQWKLVPSVTLFAQTQVAVTARQLCVREPSLPQEQAIVRAIFYHYAYVLHEAATAQKLAVRDQAYVELLVYVERFVRKVLNKWSIDTPDITFLENTHQTIIEQAVRSLASLEEPHALFQWINVITERTVGRLVKRESQLPVPESALPGVLEVPDVPIYTKDLWSEADHRVRDVVQKCLQSPHHQFVILALFGKSLRLAQIAHQLNVSAKQVSQWKFRALATLRKCPEMIQMLRWATR